MNLIGSLDNLVRFNWIGLDLSHTAPVWPHRRITRYHLLYHYFAAKDWWSSIYKSSHGLRIELRTTASLYFSFPLCFHFSTRSWIWTFPTYQRKTIHNCLSAWSADFLYLTYFLSHGAKCSHLNKSEYVRLRYSEKLIIIESLSDYSNGTNWNC